MTHCGVLLRYDNYLWVIPKATFGLVVQIIITIMTFGPIHSFKVLCSVPNIFSVFQKGNNGKESLTLYIEYVEFLFWGSTRKSITPLRFCVVDQAFIMNHFHFHIGWLWFERCTSLPSMRYLEKDNTVVKYIVELFSVDWCMTTKRPWD